MTADAVTFCIDADIRAFTADTDLRLTRYFGLADGVFLGLQADYELMRRLKFVPQQNLIKPISPGAGSGNGWVPRSWRNTIVIAATIAPSC